MESWINFCPVLESNLIVCLSESYCCCCSVTPRVPLRGSHGLSAFRLLVFYILSHTIIMVLFYIISISYCKLYAVGQKFVTTLSHAFAGVFVSSWKKGFLGIGVASCLVPSAICRAIAAAASRRARIGRQQFSVFSTGSDLVRRRQCTAPD